MFDEKDKNLILTSINWEKLRDKSILLIGASGFISKIFISSFILANKYFNLNCELIVGGRDLMVFDSDNVLYLPINILDKNESYPICDYIIHASCPADNKFAHEKPLELLDICINGTRNILEATYSGSQILYLSSGAVYGEGQKLDDFSEDKYNNNFNWIDNPSAYTQGKRTAETICALYNQKYNANIKIARIFSTFGPGMNLDSNFAISAFIKAKLNNEKIKLSNKNIVRSYLYSVDLIIWLWKILLEGKNNYPYNVGSETPVVLESLAKKFNCDIEKIDEKFISNSGSLYVPVCRRAKELGLQENYTLVDMIDKTLKYYEN